MKAAIMGSLVDVRNVAAHKCVRLTIDIPAERALKVIEAFGWPTGVDPVTVAIARLNESAVKPSPPGATAAPRQSKTQAQTGGASWQDLSPQQQAGILCSDQAFRQFLTERFIVELGDVGHIEDADDAASMVRTVCEVASRKELETKHQARVIWHQLVADFRAWQQAPAVVG